MEPGAEIRGSQRRNPTFFSQALIFPLAPPAGQTLHLLY